MPCPPAFTRRAGRTSVARRNAAKQHNRNASPFRDMIGIGLLIRVPVISTQNREGPWGLLPFFGPDAVVLFFAAPHHALRPPERCCHRKEHAGERPHHTIIVVGLSRCQHKRNSTSMTVTNGFFQAGLPLYGEPWGGWRQSSGNHQKMSDLPTQQKSC